MTPQLAFLLNQCVICLQSNNDDSAELFLKQAIKLAPKNPDVLRFYGIIEAKRNNLEAALTYFQKALKEAPKNAFVNSNIGNIFLELKRYEEALSSYDKAIALDPNYAESYNNKGNALQGLGRYEEALSSYDKAIALDPNYAQAYSNKGNALQELRRYEEAVLFYEKAIAIAPEYVEAHSHKGHALQWLGLYDEAMAAYDQALAIRAGTDKSSPLGFQYAEAFYNKGLLLQSKRAYQEAINCFKKAIEIKSDYADAHLAAGILYLRLDDFKSGWDEHEWRWFASNSNSPIHSTTKPTWGGMKTDQRILVWPEQGVGDKILYSSMFKEVGLLSPDVIISTDGRLLPIYKRSFANLEFVDEKSAVSEDRYDLQVPMGSLMRLLRPDAESFKKACFPYLLDDKERTSSLRRSFEWLKPDQKVCGISWRSINKKVGDHKSIPLLKLAPILNLDEFEFINLQYDNIDQDLLSLEEGGFSKIHQILGIDLQDDLDSTLSLIQACDLVLTCSNSVAHMAGALNKKTILMLPFESGKLWYWHSEDGKSLCYPSVEIFSQSEQGNWDEVVDRVRLYMETLSFE